MDNKNSDATNKRRKQITSKQQTCDLQPSLDNESETRILEAIRNELPATIKSYISQEFTCLRENLNEIEKSINFMSTQYDDAMKIIADMKEEINFLKKENHTLHTNIKELQGTIKTIEHDFGKHEQWSRLQNVEIVGIPENQDEDVTDLVTKIAENAALTLTTSELEFAHRVQPKRPAGGKPRAIVVRFKNRRIKDAFLSAVRKRKNLCTTDIGIKGDSKSFFVNEHLTQRNKKLFMTCKNKAKEFSYQYVWTKNCRIYIRKDDTSPHRLISCESDLLKIV